MGGRDLSQGRCWILALLPIDSERAAERYLRIAGGITLSQWLSRGAPVPRFRQPLHRSSFDRDRKRIGYGKGIVWLSVRSIDGILRRSKGSDGRCVRRITRHPASLLNSATSDRLGLHMSNSDDGG